MDAERVPVGTLHQSPIAFQTLMDSDDYQAKLARTYASLGAQWLTPGEIFAPHYARAVARYALASASERARRGGLCVYEIGGGNGTFACGFMDYVREHARETYESMKYVSIDISSALSARQRRFARASGHEEKTHVAITSDALRSSSWGEPNNEECFVIALEVFDNLPHDRVRRARRGRGAWTQTEVARASDGSNVEVEKPLNDALIKKTIEAIEMSWDLTLEGGVGAYAPPRGAAALFVAALKNLTSSGETWFVPSGLMTLMETLHSRRPNHRLIAADFDALPNVRIEGVNAPLVASQRDGGRTVDHDSYMLPPDRTADVFFPTCFDTVRGIDFVASSANAGLERARLGRIVATKDFMREYADCHLTRTKSGYNPLLQDFANTKFYLS